MSINPFRLTRLSPATAGEGERDSEIQCERHKEVRPRSGQPLAASPVKAWRCVHAGFGGLPSARLTNSFRFTDIPINPGASLTTLSALSNQSSFCSNLSRNFVERVRQNCAKP